MKKTIIGSHYATYQSIEVTIEDEIIVGIESIPNPKKQKLKYIAPGLVDLQINGYMGFDFNTLPIKENLVKSLTEAIWREGITTYYPTIITNSDEAIEQAVKTIAEACKRDSFINKCISGIHIEGPFISPEDGPRGAHNQIYVNAPDWRLVQKWQEAADGKIKIMTISPEWSNSLEFIRKCTEHGIVVSIGHTAATVEQVRAAVQAGAKMSTHLGNAAHLMLPRHPHYIWEQLAQDDLWACLIADGFHLPESFLKVAIKVKEAKTILVSDAVSLSGLEPGHYESHIGGHVVLTREGKLHLKDHPNMLAGSVQMLKEGISHLVNSNISTLQEAWDMASIHPSTFMGLLSRNGLKIGAPADLVVFNMKDNQVNICETYKSGKLVYSQ